MISCDPPGRLLLQKKITPRKSAPERRLWSAGEADAREVGPPRRPGRTL